MPVINVTITEIIILQSGGGERQEDSHSRMVLGKLRNLFKQTSNLLWSRLSRLQYTPVEWSDVEWWAGEQSGLGGLTVTVMPTPGTVRLQPLTAASSLGLRLLSSASSSSSSSTLSLSPPHPCSTRHHNQNVREASDCVSDQSSTVYTNTACQSTAHIHLNLPQSRFRHKSNVTLNNWPIMKTKQIINEQKH